MAIGSLHHTKGVAVCFNNAIWCDLICPGAAWYPGPLLLALAESASVIDWECGTIKPLPLTP